MGLSRFQSHGEDGASQTSRRHWVWKLHQMWKKWKFHEGLGTVRCRTLPTAWLLAESSRGMIPTRRTSQPATLRLPWHRGIGLHLLPRGHHHHQCDGGVCLRSRRRCRGPRPERQRGYEPSPPRWQGQALEIAGHCLQEMLVDVFVELRPWMLRGYTRGERSGGAQGWLLPPRLLQLLIAFRACCGLLHYWRARGWHAWRRALGERRHHRGEASSRHLSPLPQGLARRQWSCCLRGLGWLQHPGRQGRCLQFDERHWRWPF
mmetsp:Transcript_88387/g.223130  ORF Transcript_88387/g.223130 Transcript_88387/m.223130 type:complete len:261 (+) Transcript_88387:3830-4612(+)